MRRVHCVLPGQPVCLNIVRKARRNCLFVTQTSLIWNHPVWVGCLPPPKGFLILPEFLPGFQLRRWGIVKGPGKLLHCNWAQAAGRSSWKWLLVNPGLFLGRRHFIHSMELRAISWCELYCCQSSFCYYPLALTVTFFCPLEAKAWKTAFATSLLGYVTTWSALVVMNYHNFILLVNYQSSPKN